MSVRGEARQHSIGVRDLLPSHPVGPQSVAVVVPCRNEGRRIAALLDAIAGQDRLPDEVIIVDDASIDDSVAAIEEWGRRRPAVPVRILHSSGRGAGAAMNIGIADATGDIVVRLDGHSQPAPDYIRLALETLARPGAGLVGGVWQIEPAAPTRFGRVVAAVVSHPIGSGGASYRHADAGPPRVEAVDTVPFGCFRKSLWEELGGFDERLIANQDYDFNYRVRSAGYLVLLNSTIRCVYRSRATFGQLARQYHRYGFWKRQMLRKSPEALRWRQVPPILLLPWLVVTAAVASFTGHPLAMTLAAGYPLIAIGGALDIARRLRDPAAVPAAVAAILTVHLAWSAGFWRGLMGRRPEFISKPIVP